MSIPMLYPCYIVLDSKKTKKNLEVLDFLYKFAVIKRYN